ncbi:MAG TPA: GNAT family N-acetyltransferase [Actinopolymorphaceae bacterium]
MAGRSLDSSDSSKPPRELGNGLTLRWSRADDTERITRLVGHAFRRRPDDAPDRSLQDLVRRYMRGDYPFMGPGDFILVEDTQRDDQVVACACYLREEWEFDGISLPVGRPEIVATDPEYRNRGLIRAAFAALHERCEEDQTLVQAITGIPYFYRQFGYEYAVDLGGQTAVPVTMLPEAPGAQDGQPEAVAYRLRPARADEVSFLADCYRHQQRDSLVTTVLPDAFWRYHIAAEQEPGPLLSYLRIRVIETDRGDRCGFIVTPCQRSGDSIRVYLAAFAPGTNVSAMVPSLLRALRTLGEQIPAHPSDKPLRKVVLELGREHPLYDALPAGWLPHREPPYAWYVRVPDLPRLLGRITPALERRIADSSYAGYDGELLIDSYRGGLRLTFVKGSLETVSQHRFGPYDDSASAGIPTLAFLRLLFGYSSLDELRSAYPDVWVKGEVRGFFEALFPKRPSRVFPT